MSSVALIGSGSWGTAIAHLLATHGHEVRMWTRRSELAEEINVKHENQRYLPGVSLPDIHACTDFEETLAGSDAVVFVCPSVYLRTIAVQCAPFIPDDEPIVVLSKGIEARTGYTMVEVLSDVLGNLERMACLSGPNHAEEVSRGLPSATVVASQSRDCALFFQSLFSTSAFRVYTSNDVMGVELCAASKNIIAIANGMCVAMELGDNASAALITRGLAEVSRLVEALGGNPLTCLGLAGVGDLIATCSSAHSRNRSLGEFLVDGGSVEEFEKKTHMVAEGAVACKTVTALAREHGVEMPIAELVNRVMTDGLDPHEAAVSLFERPARPETDSLKKDSERQ